MMIDEGHVKTPEQIEAEKELAKAKKLAEPKKAIGTLL